MYEGQIVQIGTPEELFEKPKHTFVGYFIGSPGMNVFPISVDGKKVRLGGEAIDLGYAPKINQGQKAELGIRPEFMDIGKKGLPLSIRKVEDIGRQKIVRGEMAGQPVSIVVKEDKEIPSEPRVSFQDKGINIYADSWRVGREA